MRNNKALMWVGIGIVVLLVLRFIGNVAIHPQLKYMAEKRTTVDRTRMANFALSREEAMPQERIAFSGSTLAAIPQAASKAINRNAAPQIVDRKLIRKAELNLEVKSCDDTFTKISEMVSSISGVIVDSQTQGLADEPKSGYAVIKLSPKDFDSMVLKLKVLGKVEMERVTGEDVTEEYVDLNARLKNAEVVRDRLMKVLEDKAYKVPDIVEVEHELSRVGETIEQLKGRMQYLDRQTDMATITVNYHEPKKTVPGEPTVSRGFKDTMRIAIDSFIGVFNGLIVTTAVLLPLLIWIGIIAGIVIVVRKLFLKK